MATRKSKPKLLVIVGPTASGKSDLALQIAKRFGGEIIAADSRTVYKYMDLGTAKPNAKDRKSVRHWGLDLIKPTENFSAKAFKDYALAAIADIQRRGKLPVLVGGTGLYIDSIIFDYDFKSSREPDPINPRHRLQKGSARTSLTKSTVAIGLDPGKEELASRIENRVNKIVGPAFIAEATKLFERYSPELESFKATSYQPFYLFFQGKIDLEEAKKRFIQNDLRLAKRQRTWFKRNMFIKWYSDKKTAYKELCKLLNT